MWIDEAEILVGDSLIAKVEAGIDYRSTQFRVRRDLTPLQQ